MCGPAEIVDSWASHQGQPNHRAAVAQLQKLQLLRPTGAGMVQLHAGFQRQLQAAVSGGCASSSAGVPLLTSR